MPRLPLALPLGCNCQLGIALTGYGHHESSLLRWANLPLAALIAFIESGGQPFVGRAGFRFTGVDFGTLTFEQMRARLAEAPPQARVNTIVHTADGGGYAHGVQLTLAEAARLAPQAIDAANAAKFAHLAAKWEATLSGAEPVAALRLEWAAVVDAAPYQRLAATLVRKAPALQLFVITPPGGVEGRVDGVGFLPLHAELPPLSDVMNISATQGAWSAIFADLGVAPTGVAKAYIFDD